MQTRSRWWGLVVVGSLLSILGRPLHSVDAKVSTTAKRHATTVTRDEQEPKASQAHHQKGGHPARHQVSVHGQGQTPSRRVQAGTHTRHAQLHSRVHSHHLVARQAAPIGSRRVVIPFSLSSSESPALPPSQTFAAALLADAETGQVLFSHNDHREWPTASLAKMMVGLLTLEALDHGEVSLRSPVSISRRASIAGGRMINLRPGEVFPLEELLRAMMVTSANDAAVALAEHLKGSVEACVLAMNRRAQQLGMQQTQYQTPNGLPLRDGRPPDISSAADQAILGRALAKHHLLLEWTSLSRVPFRRGTTYLPNTNHLVGQVVGVDGLKTGFTAQARFNLVTTAQRGPVRLIAVVLGGQSSGLRFHTAANLLEWGFAHFVRKDVIESGQPVGAEVRVEQGSSSTLQPVAASTVSLLVEKNAAEDLHVISQTPPIIAAPITHAQVLGQVEVRDKDHTIAVIPAVSPEDIPRARWAFARH